MRQQQSVRLSKPQIFDWGWKLDVSSISLDYKRMEDLKNDFLKLFIADKICIVALFQALLVFRKQLYHMQCFEKCRTFMINVQDFEVISIRMCNFDDISLKLRQISSSRHYCMHDDP